MLEIVEERGFLHHENRKGTIDYVWGSEREWIYIAFRLILFYILLRPLDKDECKIP